jgi:hypothetical protein
LASRACEALLSEAKEMEKDAKAGREMLDAGAVDFLAALLKRRDELPLSLLTLAAEAIGNLAASSLTEAKAEITAAGCLELLLDCVELATRPMADGFCCCWI